MEQFTDILRRKLAEPVQVKGRDTYISPQEAMVMAVMSDAMHGNISAINFIRALTEQQPAPNPAAEQAQAQRLADTIAELHALLTADALTPPDNSPELELLARQLIVLRQVGQLVTADGAQPITVTPSKSGGDKTELSATNKIFNDLLKQWRNDWVEYYRALSQRTMQRNILLKTKKK